MNGLFRIASGARIVESSYDYDTHMIGPYKCYVDIAPPEKISNNQTSWHTLYDLLVSNEDALAVFDNNYTTLVVIYYNAIDVIIQHAAMADKHPELAHHYDVSNLPPQIQYRHIGYERTELKCKSVFIQPYHLIQNPENNIIMGFGVTPDDEPVVNPPISLYAELTKTNHKAVYLSKNTGNPIFLD